MEEITIGYPRVSTPTQSLDRQIQNIKAAYPSAILFPEKFTGTKIDRPEWNKLIRLGYAEVAKGKKVRRVL